jgi:hypothetical protein
VKKLFAIVLTLVFATGMCVTLSGCPKGDTKAGGTGTGTGGAGATATK